VTTVITGLIDFFLLVFLVATAFVMIRLRDLFAAVMLAGIFSLLSAGLFLVMDAVDVAFTEAAVGAGISTVLMVGTLAFTRRRERGKRDEKPRLQPVPLAVSLLLGGALFYGTLDMPGYGDPEAPIHNYMAPRFLERSAEEVGPPNVVTSVLASYRGYDTFGETTVIFTAAIGVLLLLSRRRPRSAAQDDTREPTEANPGTRDPRPL
jgi:multicomponent Na+:H+ antiporter subunit B